MSLGFPREARITRGAELQRIAREGKRIRTKHLEVRVAASPLLHLQESWKGPRLGLIVPRFKHSAVSRNLVKRRLRELGRIHILTLAISADLVVRIRPEAYRASFTDLAGEIFGVVPQLERWFGSQAPKAHANESPDT